LNSIEASYRSEIKDLFEAHFARFEERLEHPLTETRAELQAEFREEIARLGIEVYSVKADLIKTNLSTVYPSRNPQSGAGTARR
jgi:hypothetical protein